MCEHNEDSVKTYCYTWEQKKYAYDNGYRKGHKNGVSMGYERAIKEIFTILAEVFKELRISPRKVAKLMEKYNTITPTISLNGLDIFACLTKDK